MSNAIKTVSAAELRSAITVAINQLSNQKNAEQDIEMLRAALQEMESGDPMPLNLAKAARFLKQHGWLF